MKKLLSCLMILMVFSIGVFADVKILKKMEKGEAEIIVTEKTFNEVVNAVIKVLMKSKFRILESSDKKEGLILAEQRKGIFYDKGDTLSSWEILIVDEGKAISVSCFYVKGDAQMLQKEKNIFKKFYEKLSDYLN